MHGYFKFVRETSYYPMKRKTTSIDATFAVKIGNNIFYHMFRGKALIKLYFNYWRQSNRLRHGAVTKHVATSPLFFLLLLSDFLDYAEICDQLGKVDYCRIIPVEVCLMSRRVRIFAPSLPIEFSLCVVHQLNYTAGWMELFPAVYYYRQPAAPPADNTSIFSNAEHHGNHSVVEARKWVNKT